MESTDQARSSCACFNDLHPPGAHKNAPYGTAAAVRAFLSNSFGVLNPPKEFEFFFIFKPLPFGRPRSVLTFQGDFWNLQAKPVHPVHVSTTYTPSGAHKNAPYGTAAAVRAFPSSSFSVLNPPQHEHPSISDGNIKARVGSSSLLIGQIV